MTVGARPRKPLSNIPGIASVGGKKKKRVAETRMLELAGVAWIIRKLYARPSHCVAECIQR